MADANDTAVVADTQDDTTNPAPPVTEPPKQEPQADYRPKLSDEEQLQVLEGRAQRLRTKLGKDDQDKQASAPDAPDLSEKAYLRAAGITDAEEVVLAFKTAKKFGVSIDQIVDDEDFKTKLEKHRATKANEQATSDIQGSGNAQGTNQTVEYWKAKGTHPTPSDIPDSKVRRGIVRELLESAKSGSGKKFYNDK